MHELRAETSDDSDQPGPRYLSLRAARAIDCNGCGDCCDSRRTEGYWTWGALPAHQYRALNDGAPLIIPLARLDGGWMEREHGAGDEQDLTPVRFRCTAFRPQPDGRGLCAFHDRERPSKCGDFPVGGAQIEDELARYGEVVLPTDAFPRCGWYGVTVVHDGDPRIAAD